MSNNDESNIDDNNPNNGILADLEQLASKKPRRGDHEVDKARLAQLDDIANAADEVHGPQHEPGAKKHAPERAAGSLSFSSAPAEDSAAPAGAGTEDEEEAGEETQAALPGFDAYNPFSFGMPAQPAQPVRVSTAGSAGLLFQTPDAELGQKADPEWTPDEDEDDEDRSADNSSDLNRDRADDDEDDDRGSGDRDQDDRDSGQSGKKRRRGGRGRRSKRDRAGDDSAKDEDESAEPGQKGEGSAAAESGERDGGKDTADDGGTSDDKADSGSGRRRRRSRERGGSAKDEVTGVKGSTRLEAKRQRRQEGRAAGRRRPLITEAEFLARRESVERTMLVRQKDGRTQLVTLEDGIAVEHYLSEDRAQASLIGNVYLGKVQNVLPSMEAAFIDIGKGRNAVLYAGEVNWDALGMDGKPRRIEVALSPGDSVLVQVTKDPIGHKGARLTSQISLPGRYLVYVPGNSMTGISRKLPDNERQRLKKLLKEIVPDGSGVIVRTAAEGAAESDLARDVDRLSKRWETIESKSKSTKVLAPKLLYSEPDMTLRIIRDVFNEDFGSLVIEGDKAWDDIHEYVESVAPDLLDRVHKYDEDGDIFTHYRVDEQIEKALNRVVHLPSGGSLVIDRTEAMTVIDVNTGKFTGSGGNLEETVTKNNLEAAEEVIRQLRLRDIGGIIVVDFIDMVLESNRDLVVRRLVECLGRDRTKHQVAEVTSLGLVQMTRKRIGTGLAEGLAAAGEDMTGRGLMLPGTEPDPNAKKFRSRKSNKDHGGSGGGHGGHHDAPKAAQEPEVDKAEQERQEASRSAMAAIAKATIKKDDEAAAAPADAPAAAGDDSADRGTAKDAPKKKRDRRRKKKDVRESAPEADSTPASEPAPEPAPEPKGPAPLMIGGDSETRVQVAEAPKKKAPKRKAPAGEQPKPEASTGSETPAPPILIIGGE